MGIKAKDLKEALAQVDDDAELRIGTGKRDIPVNEIFVTCFGSKVIFASMGYANWKRRRQMVY